MSDVVRGRVRWGWHVNLLMCDTGVHSKSIELVIEGKTFSPSYDLPSSPAPYPPHVSKVSLFLSLSVCHRSILLRGGRSGGRAKSYNGEKALYSVYAIVYITVYICHPLKWELQIRCNLFFSLILKWTNRWRFYPWLQSYCMFCICPYRPWHIIYFNNRQKVFFLSRPSPFSMGQGAVFQFTLS